MVATFFFFAAAGFLAGAGFLVADFLAGAAAFFGAGFLLTTFAAGDGAAGSAAQTSTPVTGDTGTIAGPSLRLQRLVASEHTLRASDDHLRVLAAGVSNYSMVNVTE